ncbi:hypothetical protein AB1Y20_005045 [Prymnesium parvum]
MAADPIHLLSPVEGDEAILSLDALVLTMCLVTLVHASWTRALPLAFAGFCLGISIEQASLRLGGTHCHASGIFDFSKCSSGNSVLYYVPWVYAGVTAARRLVSERSWAFPLLCGMLFSGMCGVYESQGPLMGWWAWPPANRVVMPGCAIWQAWELGEDARGLVASPHVAEALEERVFGVPVMALLYHFAFGWGTAVVYQLTRFKSTFVPVLVGPALALLWDPAMRAICYGFGASKLAAVVALLLLSCFVALLLGPPLRPSPPRDLLLFTIPLLNAAFFTRHAIYGAGATVLPPDLKVFVATVAVVATLAYARACGLLSNVAGKTK